MSRRAFLVALLLGGCGGEIESSSSSAQSAAPEDATPSGDTRPSHAATCGSAPEVETARELDKGFEGFHGVATDGAYVYYAATTRTQVLRQPIGGGPREVFATDKPEVSAMRGHGTRVCWVGAAAFCVENGGAPRMIAASAGKRRTDLGWEEDVDFDDSYLYWLSEEKVERAPLDGSGKVEVLADRQADPRTVAVAGGRVVWVNYTDGAVKVCPVSGCSWPPTEIARIPDVDQLSFPDRGPVLVGRIAADDQFAYLALHRAGPNGREGSVVRIPLAGGLPATIWSCAGESGVNVTVEGNRAYLLTHAGGFNHYGETTRGNVIEIDLSSGATRSLASGQRSPQDLAVTGGLVFWTNETSNEVTFPEHGALMVAQR